MQKKRIGEPTSSVTIYEDGDLEKSLEAELRIAALSMVIDPSHFRQSDDIASKSFDRLLFASFIAEFIPCAFTIKLGFKHYVCYFLTVDDM